MEIIALTGSFAAAAALLRTDGDRLAATGARAVAAVALLAALGAAAWAPGAPTGWGPLDVLLRAGLAGAVVVAAARTRPGWMLAGAAAAGAVAVATSSPLASLPLAATGAIAAVMASGLAAPVLVAVGAALTTPALLRLAGPAPTGATAVIAGACVTPVLAAWVGGLAPRRRRALAWSLAGVMAAASLAVGGGALAALQAQGSLRRGVDAARDGLGALGRGQGPAARARLDDAARAFGEARGSLSAWWSRPARAVPLVAQQARALETVASTGQALAGAASGAVASAEAVGNLSGDGRVDLDAVRALQEPLERVRAGLEAAASRLEAAGSPWLLGPVAESREALADRVEAARPGAAAAAEAARLAPALLGGEGPRRYFLAIQTPSESRGAGGLMGNWGELTAVDGRVELSRFGRLAELVEGGVAPSRRRVVGHAAYEARYGAHAARIWGLVNLSTDFPTVADIMAQLYPQSGGQPVDGVIAVDPYAYAALLELTGPVPAAGLDRPITAARAPELLLHEQYLRFGEGEREAFLAELTATLVGKLTGGDLPPPAALGAALGPVARARHLQVASTRPAEQAFFDRIGASGAVPPRAGDSVAFVSQNYDGNKIDWFLRRSASYDVRWDPATGEVRGVLELRLGNEAPASGLPDSVIGWGGDAELGQVPVAPGENLLELSLYSSLVPGPVTVDGEPLEGRLETEFDRQVFTAMVRVPPSSSRTVRVELAGRLPPGSRYELEPFFQPMVNADRLRVQVRVPPGWDLDAVEGGQRPQPAVAVADWVLDGDRRLQLTARRGRVGSAGS